MFKNKFLGFILAVGVIAIIFFGIVMVRSWDHYRFQVENLTNRLHKIESKLVRFFKRSSQRNSEFRYIFAAVCLPLEVSFIVIQLVLFSFCSRSQHQTGLSGSSSEAARSNRICTVLSGSAGVEVSVSARASSYPGGSGVAAGECQWQSQG